MVLKKDWQTKVIALLECYWIVGSHWNFSNSNTSPS